MGLSLPVNITVCLNGLEGTIFRWSSCGGITTCCDWETLRSDCSSLESVEFTKSVSLLITWF